MSLGVVGTLGFLGLNVAIRLWMFFRSGQAWSAVVYNDEHTYLRVASELAAGAAGWFERPEQAAPGHVLLLWLLGNSVPGVKLISFAASTATLVPVLSIARRTLPPRGCFWVAVAFTACLTLDPFAFSVLTEAINVFLLTTAVSLLVRALAIETRGAAFASGLCLGLATIWRATTLLYPVALALLLVGAWAVRPIRARLAFDPLRTLKPLALHTLGLALVAAPILVKNGLTGGGWQLAPGTGAMTYLGVDQKTKGWEPYFSGYDFDTFEVSQPFTHIEPEGDRRLGVAAKRQIQRDPWGTLAMRVHWPMRLFIGEPADVFNPVRSAPESWRVLKKNATLLTIWNLGWRVLAVVFGLLYFARAWRTREGFVLASIPLYFLAVFLPLFVIVRYCIPLLPLLAVPMVGGVLEAGRARWPAGIGAALLVGGVSFWHVFVPPRVDPADYAQHTELARSPWDIAYAMADGPKRDGVQVFESMAAAPSLEAAGQGVALEHNQLVLFPVRLAPRPSGWPLHAYWRSVQAPGFSEERTTDAFLPASEKTARFRLPARTGDALAGFRVDIDLPPGAKAGVGGSDWSCAFGCTATPTEGGGVELTGGEGPEAIARAVVAPMDAAGHLDVRLTLPPLPRADRTGEVAQVWVRWRLDGEAAYGESELRVIEVPIDGQVHWIRVNPSFFPSGARWFGKLGRVSVQFANGHDLEVELGPMRILKDYRMLR